MIPDGEYTAVVDRFEDDLAVLEVSDDDDRYELVVDEHELPRNGRHADAIFEVLIEDEEFDRMRYQPEETKERKEGAQRRFDRLSKRPPDNDDTE
jgi:hypothetical protein